MIQKLWPAVLVLAAAPLGTDLGARTRTLAEEQSAQNEEFRVRLRGQGLPVMLHEIKAETAGDGDAWWMLVENVNLGRPIRIEAELRDGTEGCRPVTLVGPDRLGPETFGVFRARAAPSCGPLQLRLRIDSHAIEGQALLRMLGPFVSPEAPGLPGLVARRFARRCPAGLEQVRRGDPPAQAGICAAGPGVSFANAQEYCRLRRERLPTRREAIAWLAARRRLFTEYKYFFRLPSARVWTADPFMQGDRSVWALDITRNELVGRQRTDSALALCVPLSAELPLSREQTSARIPGAAQTR